MLQESDTAPAQPRPRLAEPSIPLTHSGVADFLPSPHTHSQVSSPVTTLPPSHLALVTHRAPVLSPAQRVDASPKQTERPVDIIDSLRGRFLARVWFLFYPLCTWSASGPFFAQFIRTTANSSIWIIESGSEFYVVSCSLWHNIMKFVVWIVVWMS